MIMSGKQVESCYNLLSPISLAPEIPRSPRDIILLLLFFTDKNEYKRSLQSETSKYIKSLNVHPCPIKTSILITKMQNY